MFIWWKVSKELERALSAYSTLFMLPLSCLTEFDAAPFNG